MSLVRIAGLYIFFRSSFASSLCNNASESESEPEGAGSCKLQEHAYIHDVPCHAMPYHGRYLLPNQAGVASFSHLQGRAQHTKRERERESLIRSRGPRSAAGRHGCSPEHKTQYVRNMGG